MAPTFSTQAVLPAGSLSKALWLAASATVALSTSPADGSICLPGSDSCEAEAPGLSQRDHLMLQLPGDHIQRLGGLVRNAVVQDQPPPPNQVVEAGEEAATLGHLREAAKAVAAGGWKSFGSGTSCGQSAAERTQLSTAATQRHVGSLPACKALCKQRRRSGCSAVEYAVATGQCMLLSSEVRYAHPAEGSECASLVAGADVYLMLPLDTIGSDGKLRDPLALGAMFDAMVATDVDGFMVDVWWGLTEPQPQEYDFSGYRDLFEMARVRDWKVQAVASFHRCGGNVGDSCNIPLPPFVLEAEGIWYTDSEGVENKEYISLFADEVDVGGRSPVRMYQDWMQAFGQEFATDLGSLITELMVGMGPCGELRFPSYPLDRWEFCGVGQFQAFDPHALASLKAAAQTKGHPDWSAPPGPDTAGSYKSLPDDTDFFTTGYQTDKGKFFLEWYSGALKAHGSRVLAAAQHAMRGRTRLTGKVAGIHWWYDTEAHAAEATAGYYNTNGRNAYDELAGVMAAANSSLDFTCMEMRNSEQPKQCKSNPENLVKQAISAARAHGVEMGGENALLRYDGDAMGQMISYRSHLSSLSFLRLNPNLVKPRNLARFAGLVMGLHGDETGAAALAHLAEA